MMALLRALLCMLGAVSFGLSLAQTWPAKPVKMVITIGPGSSTDLVARLLSDRLSRSLGQSFVVESIAGAGGNIGALAVARSAPDGYTFMFAGGGTLVTNQFAFKSMPFDAARDFVAVALVTTGGGFVIAVAADSPAKDFAGLVALAKSKPKALSYAVDASNVYAALTGKLLNRIAGMDMEEIPYKSSAQALQDTVAGRTHLMVTTVGVVEVMARTGKLRVLAISAAKRNPLVPDIPSMSETIPGLAVDAVGFSLVAPAGTPADIVQRLNRAVNAIMREAEFEKQVATWGLPTARPNTAEEAAEELRQQRVSWGKIYQDLGIQPQ
jgi:tripartite-type tricarboxylate transporter receptor subunit TctC